MEPGAACSAHGEIRNLQNFDRETLREEITWCNVFPPQVRGSWLVRGLFYAVLKAKDKKAKLSLCLTKHNAIKKTYALLI